MYKTTLVNKENSIKDNFLRRIELKEIKSVEEKNILIEKNK